MSILEFMEHCVNKNEQAVRLLNLDTHDRIATCIYDNMPIKYALKKVWNWWIDDDGILVIMIEL